MLHAPCSEVNAPCAAVLHTSCVDDLWQRVIARIQEAHPNERGRELTWLAGKLGTKVQAVQNWKTRGIPPRQHAGLATALGWTVDQLLGNAAPAPTRWPFERVPFDRFSGYSEREQGVIEEAMLDAMDKLDARRPASGKQQRSAA